MVVRDGGRRACGGCEHTRAEDNGWWVVDVQTPGDHQVVIGPRTGAVCSCTGRPLNRFLRGPAARILPGAARSAAVSGDPVQEQTVVRDHLLTVTALPVRGPSGEVVAVVCALRPSDTVAALPPPLRAWEWDTRAEQGRGVPVSLQGQDPPDYHPTSFCLAEYTLGLTAESMTPLWNLWQQFSTSRTDSLLYETVTRVGADGVHHRELLCGRPRFSDDVEFPVAFRGVSLDVTDRPVDPGHRRFSDEVLTAVLAHSVPTFAVAYSDGHVFHWMSPPPSRVVWPADPYLQRMVHPEDRGVLTECLGRVTVYGSSTQCVVRLPDTEGGWRRMEMKLSAVRIDEGLFGDLQLLVALTAVIS